MKLKKWAVFPAAPLRRCLAGLLLAMCAFPQLQAQDSVTVVSEVRDAFLKRPLSTVQVSLFAADSTLLVDMLPHTHIMDVGGVLRKVCAVAKVKSGVTYLLRARLDRYADVWHTLQVPVGGSEKQVDGEPFEMRRVRTIDLNAATVKATQVKMVYRGDTLVYNADAFQLPDGSMLDELIRQLPGVKMNDNGEIFVNGRKVDELLLGSRSFMHGNKKVLLENLPYYTVKHIKVYEQQSDRSRAMGYDVDPRRYVMDVNLKPEYSVGYIANVEGAAGTQDRWLARGFLLGFTDRWRYALKANMNNVDEGRHIGEYGQWTPNTMPKSLTDTRSVATDLDYMSQDKNTKNNFTADYTVTSVDQDMHSRQEYFLENSRPTALTQSADRSENRHLHLRDALSLTRSYYFSWVGDYEYEERNAHGASLYDQWDETPAASMRTDYLNKGRKWLVKQQMSGMINVNKAKENSISWGTYFEHEDDRSWNALRFDTWQKGAPDNRVSHNADDVLARSTYASGHAYLNLSDIGSGFGLTLGDLFSYSALRNRDYLYHPDTLMLASQLDMLTAITDPSNSYDSHLRSVNNKVSMHLRRRGNYHYPSLPNFTVLYDKWDVGVELPLLRRSLDYRRGAIDTVAHETWWRVQPFVKFRYMTPDGSRDLRADVCYEAGAPWLLDRMDYRDDSRPLAVVLGNPALKGTSTTKATLTYRTNGPNGRMWNAGADADFRHRATAQSVVYDPATGVYTYRPVNVYGGFRGNVRFGMSGNLGKKSPFSWQTNADANYEHSVDQAMLAGETANHRNTVNTTVMHDDACLRYNRKTLDIRLSGDIRWRHSEGRMRDFSTLDAVDFNYGLSARYTLPVVKTTVSADATVYSRRGYGSRTLNTDDFVMNASLSQPFLKGKLIVCVEAFDLLHHLSSTQYAVNAQGRTETWYRSLPHYVMMHLVYHWNKNPKK